MFAGYQNIHQNVTPKLNTDFRKSLDLAFKEIKVDEKEAALEAKKAVVDEKEAALEAKKAVVEAKKAALEAKKAALAQIEEYGAQAVNLNGKADKL